MSSRAAVNATDVRELPARIEALLDGLSESGDPAVAERADELVAAVVTLYGEGLGRIIELVAAAPGGEQLVRELAADGLVGNLMLLHELHPDDVVTRIQAALDRVRPYLGSHAGGIEFLGVDDLGIAHLRLQGSCDSCPSSSVTVQSSVERAVLEAAPEVVRVDVEGMVPFQPLPERGSLLQIQPYRPDLDGCPVPEVAVR
jgi:Fe-S cluster biogenesis protein NfuA